MRERLDCAVLLTHCSLEWVGPILGQHAGGRLHLHGFDTITNIEDKDAHLVLAAACMGLRRHDACLLPVSPSSLSWARTALSRAIPRLQTPVMALVQNLTAGALNDLFDLGVADFLRYPFCAHEARVRIERLLNGRRTIARSAAADAAAHGHSQYAMEDVVFERMCKNILNSHGAELEDYATAAASRSTACRESFQEAKSKVIERFERAYINAALGRHGGNIAMAARAAQKHRRAFWALMRKHDIDAAPFRAQGSQVAPLSGPGPRSIPSPVVVTCRTDGSGG